MASRGAWGICMSRFDISSRCFPRQILLWTALIYIYTRTSSRVTVWVRVRVRCPPFECTVYGAVMQERCFASGGRWTRSRRSNSWSTGWEGALLWGLPLLWHMASASCITSSTITSTWWRSLALYLIPQFSEWCVYLQVQLASMQNMGQGTKYDPHVEDAMRMIADTKMAGVYNYTKACTWFGVLIINI